MLKLRVFISSTFMDMTQIRDLIMGKVRIAIRDYALKKGIDIDFVDTRWGITPEQQQDGRVVELCLRQIDQCRPLFIGLLGKRYGWCPSMSDFTNNPTLQKLYPQIEQYYKQGVSITEMEMLYGVLQSQKATKAVFFVSDDWTKNNGKITGVENAYLLNKLYSRIINGEGYDVIQYGEDELLDVECYLSSWLQDRVDETQVVDIAEEEDFPENKPLEILQSEFFQKLSDAGKGLTEEQKSVILQGTNFGTRDDLRDFYEDLLTHGTFEDLDIFIRWRANVSREDYVISELMRAKGVCGKRLDMLVVYMYLSSVGFPEKQIVNLAVYEGLGSSIVYLVESFKFVESYFFNAERYYRIKDSFRQVVHSVICAPHREEDVRIALINALLVENTSYRDTCTDHYQRILWDYLSECAGDTPVKPQSDWDAADYAILEQIKHTGCLDRLVFEKEVTINNLLQQYKDQTKDWSHQEELAYYYERYALLRLSMENPFYWNKHNVGESLNHLLPYLDRRTVLFTSEERNTIYTYCKDVTKWFLDTEDEQIWEAYDDLRDFIHDDHDYYLSDFNFETVHHKFYLQSEDSSLSRICYEGEWIDGEFHGTGLLEYPNGDIYEGDLVDYRSSEQGTYICLSDENSYNLKFGEKFEGKFNDGAPSSGIRYCNNGSEIIGYTYLENFPLLIRYPGGVIYKGELKNMKFHKEGVLYLPSGVVLMGSWEEGKRIGRMVAFMPDGRTDSKIYTKEEAYRFPEDWYNVGELYARLEDGFEYAEFAELADQSPKYLDKWLSSINNDPNFKLTDNLANYVVKTYPDALTDSAVIRLYPQACRFIIDEHLSDEFPIEFGEPYLYKNDNVQKYGRFQSHYREYQKKCEELVLRYKRLIEVLESQDAVDTEFFVNTYNSAGNFCREIEDFESAIKYYEKVYQLVIHSSLEEKEGYISLYYYNMAMVMYYQGEVTNALEYFQRSYDIDRKMCGEKDHSTLMNLYRVAIVHEYTSDETVVSILRTVLRGVSDEDWNFWPRMSIIYEKLAKACFRLNDVKHGQNYYGHCLAIRRRELGDEKHPLLIKTYLEYSDECERFGLTQMRIHLLRKAALVGNVDACLELADIDSERQDYDSVIYWLRTARYHGQEVDDRLSEVKKLNKKKKAYLKKAK